MRNESHDYHPRISRRHLLRGIGATLTLPWLEGLAYADGGHAAVEAGPPRRWAALVFANGVVGPDWHAKQTSEGIVFSDVLSPLTPHQQDIIFFDNMRLVSKAPPMNIHRYHYTNMLSGEPVPGKSVRKLATSADYHMARLLGANTVVPVFNLGCRMSSKSIETNCSTISWSSPTTPVIPECYPRQAFDRLFDVQQKIRDKSILDGVLDQVHWLERRLGHHDRQRLAQYTDSVRTVELEIDRAIHNERDPNAWKPTLDAPNLPRPEAGIPPTIPAYFKLMMDLVLLAFQMDMTRIATLQFNDDTENEMKFGFLDGLPNYGHHSFSHHGKDPVKIGHANQVVKFHVEQLAYFLQRMKEIDERGQCMLDSSMIFYGTNFIDGNRHDASSMPLLVAGRGGGTIKGGKVFRAEREEDRPVMNVVLSMMQRMGIAQDQFGDSHHAFDFLA